LSETKIQSLVVRRRILKFNDEEKIEFIEEEF
jgi:hypothetical protein